MYLNKERVRALMDEKAEGNYHEFARQLDLDVAHVHRVLNANSKAGAKFFGKLMRYCQKNGLDFQHYIFLEEPLHACNSKRLKKTGTSGS